MRQVLPFKRSFNKPTLRLRYNRYLLIKEGNLKLVAKVKFLLFLSLDIVLLQIQLQGLLMAGLEKTPSLDNSQANKARMDLH